MKYIISFFIILLTLSFTQDRSVVITGTCLLEGENDHSGIAIDFQAVSGSAEDNTFYTDDTGAFIAALPEGIYTVNYSYDEFLPQTLPGEISFFSDIELEAVTLIAGSIIEISGTLYGNQRWTPNFQYHVTDDLTLSSGDTLTIDPGVNVLFMGEYEFLVQGAFYANGAESDSIRFTSGQNSKQKGDWKSLQFENADSSSFLNYSVVEFAGGPNDGNYNIGGVSTGHSRLLINNSNIHSSSNLGIFSSNSEIIINNSLIHNNDFKGIYIYEQSTADMSSNEIYNNNNHGVEIRDSYANISNNHIHNNNFYYALYIYDSDVDIIGNDVHNNNYGFSLRYVSYGNIIGNNIYNNNAQGIRLDDSISDIIGNDIHNNGDWGIYTSFSTTNIIGNNINNNYGGGEFSNSITLIRNNNIHNNYTILRIVGTTVGHMKNNITWSNNNFDIDNGDLSIEYNCFYENVTLFENNDGNLPFGFGEVITVNANGDSTDTWSNIFMDPMLTDIENGNYTPQEGSPVIDAGDPAYQDPDGSIADIGMLYFDWGTEAPVINSINVDNQIGTSPLVVQFSSDISGPATSRQWQFGDGGSSSSSNPVHIYSVPGSYTVSLTVDGPGGSASISEVDFIVVNEPTSPPVANFGSDIQSGLIPFDVQFSNISQNEIDSYLWDFGDGTSSDEESPTHTYETAGEFTVSLTATGPYGESTLNLENYITAYAPETVVASFEMSQQVCIAPCEINFTNTSIGTVDSYSWDFGDGGSSIDQNPTYTFNETGTFTINLEASGYLNTDLISQDILVLSDTPSITSITDIPNDQGGRVLINFTGSGYDGYDRTEFYTAEINIDGSWVTANFSPPYESDEYGFIVHTLTDSSASTDGMTDFRVLASMDEGVFISDVVSGYSVDNIHPTTPSDLLGTHLDNDLTLQWNYNMDIDFNYHEIKSLLDATRYSTENQVTFTQEESYDEYTVNSVDINDNSSENSDKISVHNLHYGANLVGLNVLPDNLNISIILESLELNINSIIGEGEAASLNPTLGWIGSLTNISPGGGYWIRVDSDDMLILPGESVDCGELNFNLNEGASLISYCCEQSMPLDIIPGDCSEIVGEGAASTFNPVLGWIGNLQELNPGKGYWLKCSDQIQMQWDCEE